MGYGLILFPRSTPRGADSAFGWWIEAAASVGLTVRLAFFEDITISIIGNEQEAMLDSGEVIRPDFVVMRGYCTPLSEFFEMKHIPVINSTRSMTVSRDKLLTHVALSAAGLPTPSTVWFQTPPTYSEACNLFASPRFIVKAREGSKGERVWLVDSETSYAEAVGICGGDMLLQEYVGSSRGRDLRIWVIGGKAVGAVLRHSDSDFRSNFALGGKATLYDASHEALRLAEKAAEATGLFFAGVDLLFTDSGFTICEVNGNAGFRTLSSVGGPDILKLFFKTLHDS